MTTLRALALLLGSSTLGGCFLSPIPDLKTPVDRAHALDTKCRGFSVPGALSLLPPGAVDSVEPAYSYVQSGPMAPEARMRGARIHVRPMPGMSRESLTRTLECHEASVLLAQAQPTDPDPFFLPTRWLDIDVDSEGDGFVVQVRIDDFVAARKVLERAKSYAASPRRVQPFPPSSTVRANAHASALAGSSLQID